MLTFGIDHSAVEGCPGNGNPPQALRSPEVFPLMNDGSQRMLPFGIGTPFLNTHLDQKARLVTVGELAQSGEPFYYVLAPFGPIEHALGMWDVEVHRSLFDNVSETAMACVRRGQAQIVIDDSWEGRAYHHFDLFGRIHREIERCFLSPSRVHYVTSNQIGHAAYQQWFCRARDFSIPFRVCVTNVFEDQTRRNLIANPAEFAKFKAGPKRKRFLSLNRNAPEHRQVLVSQYLRRGLDADMLLSMPHPSSGFYTAFMDGIDVWKHYFPTIHADLDALAEKTPLHLDRPDFALSVFEQSPWLYEDAHMSLISETCFRGGSGENVFNTEKTYKAIANQHPFIIANLTGSLQSLHEQGYRTFSPFINESYDDEPDDLKRLWLIIQEIERLAALPIDEIEQWTESIADTVLRHNYEVLLGKRPLSARLLEYFGA